MPLATAFIIKERDIVDMASLSQLIGSLGFPIVATVALFWWNMKQEERHKEEVGELSQAIANNTLALTELKEMLRKEDE